MSKLATIINDYLNDIDRGLVMFEKEIGRRDLIAAWREGVLDKSGVLRNGVEYELHGVGCRIFFDDYEVDFDFSVGSRVDGFDAWRLWGYAKQFPSRYPHYQDRAAIEKDFAELIASGEIVQRFPKESPLYFLVDK